MSIEGWETPTSMFLKVLGVWVHNTSHCLVLLWTRVCLQQLLLFISQFTSGFFYLYSSLTSLFVTSHTDEIVSMLETFKVPPVVIQAAITTLSQVMILYSHCGYVPTCCSSSS